MNLIASTVHVPGESADFDPFTFTNTITAKKKKKNSSGFFL